MARDIHEWLMKAGLSQYSDAFSRHHIDVSLLPQLDDKALRELGVDSLGHRLTLMRAIQNLSPVSAGAAQKQQAHNHYQGLTERRQLTVMFCDLVDSTALAAEHDAEDVRHILTAYQSMAQPIVARYAGRIAQYLGDGLLIYFGYPRAHEDDAMRATYAGLDLISQLDTLNEALFDSHNVTLSLRIGIHTGPVVVGQIGDHSTTNMLASGMTPNRAAQLQQQAKINSILVSKETRALLRETFILASAADETFEVLGPQASESRYATNMAHKDIPLIGRADEINQLRAHWQEVVSGSNRGIWITGEAGVGKSRLINTLIEELKPTDCHIIIYQCSPYHEDSPLYPVSRHLKRTLTESVGKNETPTLKSLEILLQPTAKDARDNAYHIAELADLDTKENSGDGNTKQTAEENRESTLQVLLDQLHALATKKPVLLVLEDAQWSDATTLELIHRSRLQGFIAHVLTVVTSRRGSEPEWCVAPTMYLMQLNRLQAQFISGIVNHVATGYSLHESTVAQIVDRSDGVALYAEELTKAVLPTYQRERLEAAELSLSEGSADIPSTLHDSLMARLDQMDAAKSVAQTAACIGREFDRNVLNELALESTEQLENSLLRLQNAQILIIDPSNGRERYLFRHALIRDAAYESLPKSRRTPLHSRLFEQLQAKPGTPTDVLAHHAKAARRFGEAAKLFDTAGLQAAKSAAFKEAIAHFESAVSCTHEMDDNSKARSLELDIRVHQGHASTTLNGFAHPLTARINIQARELLERVSNSPYKWPVLYGHWVIQHALGQHQTAINDADTLYNSMQSSESRSQKLVGNRLRGSTRLMLGNFRDAIHDLDVALSMRDEKEDRGLASQFGVDLMVPVRTYSALAHLCQGNVQSAMSSLEGMEETVREHAHPGTMIYAFSHLALVSQVGRLDSRSHYITIADELADTFGVRAYKGHTLGIKAMYLLDTNKVAESIECMKEALSIITQTKTYIYTPLLYGNYALALARQGKAAESRHAATAGIDMARNNQERWALAEIHRLKAVSDSLLGIKPARTQKALEQAITIAEEQGAQLWSLRATVSLAKILKDAGHQNQAYTVLTKKLDDVRETAHDLTDWQNACALLQQLQHIHS